MKTTKQIEDMIKLREAEGQSVIERFNAEKARVQKIVDNWQAFSVECKASIDHLNGCIAELRRLLPEVPKEKATKKKK